MAGNSSITRTALSALLCVAGLLVARPWVPRAVAQAPAGAANDATAAFDRLLDLNVRDGLVYYRALKSQRGPLDRFIASLNVPAATINQWERDRQAAFWLNAYNAAVLRLVIDHYPINGRAKAYPPNSVRQIPGAFDRLTWQIGGRALTLDQLETTIVASFQDPRMFLALGRGAIGSGRLRSEAYVAERLETQLAEVVNDCVRAVTCVQVDMPANTLWVSSILSWRESAFVSRYAGGARGKYPGRSPLELAAVGLSGPVLFASERAWLEENTFQMKYREFDWRLNDLTGGPPR